MDKIDRFLARIASLLAIIIALWYWIAAKSEYHLGQKLVCRYSLVWILVLVIVLIFYILLTRAILRHILLLKKHHVHHAEEQMSSTDYSIRYYSVLFEAFLIISIILVTIAGFALSSASCTLSRYI